MRRRVILITAAVVATACGGGGNSHKAANSADARGTQVATSTSVGNTTAPTAPAHLGPSAAAPPSSSAPATTAARPSSPAQASAGPAPVQPGTYRYRQSGTTTLGGSTTPVPTEGTLRIDPASGMTQVWHRATDPSKAPSDTAWQFSSDGMFITSQVQRATVGQQTFAFTCTFPTPVPAPPWPPAVGATFHGHGDCGNFTADVSGRVTGIRSVTLDGGDVPVFVIESTIITQGQVQSTTSQTDWFAPSLRLAVHTETHADGSYGFITFRSDTISDLISARPS